MGSVVAAPERSAAVDTSEVGTLTATFMGVKFGLLDGIIADFAGDCGCVSAMQLGSRRRRGGGMRDLQETMIAVFFFCGGRGVRVVLGGGGLFFLLQCRMRLCRLGTCLG